MRSVLSYTWAAVLLGIAVCGCVSTSETPPGDKTTAAPIVYQVSPEIEALGVKTLPKKESLTFVYSDRRKLVLRPGNSRTLWQDVAVQLPQAPAVDEKGTYHLAEASLRILSALFRNPDGKHFGRHIMLDAGHGGGDTGAKGIFSVEKELNLLLSLELEKELLERGFVVSQTRRQDIFIPLADRCRAAEKADMLISLHHNASASSSASGLETYAAENRKEFYASSVVLAFLIQKEIVKSTGERDRGMKTNTFFVLENSSCPAVLIEAGFISNPEEEKLLNDPMRRRKIVSAIADAVESFYRQNTRSGNPAKR